MKAIEEWHSERMHQPVRLVRWGEFGVPVLVFPTAGGDAEEIERMGLVDSVSGLLAAGRIKLYSIDSVAGRAWMERHDPLHASWLQNAFSAAVRWEVVPAIRADVDDEGAEVIAAGASIGAFNAVASVCRHPDAFRAAIGMSGTYDLGPWLGGMWTDDFYFSSPLHYLPGLGESHQLEALRRRWVVLATGTGDHENPGESWRMAGVLGGKGVPNQVDQWQGWPHDWPTWRAMLPSYLEHMA
jgi:esterase/lipase superfamily enzyme